MTPLIVAIVVTAAGCALHFVCTRPQMSAPTLAWLGQCFMLAGALAITALLTGSI